MEAIASFLAMTMARERVITRHRGRSNLLKGIKKGNLNNGRDCFVPHNDDGQETRHCETPELTVVEAIFEWYQNNDNLNNGRDCFVPRNDDGIEVSLRKDDYLGMVLY